MGGWHWGFGVLLGVVILAAISELITYLVKK